MGGMNIIIPIVTFLIGGGITWLTLRVLLKSRLESIIKEAEQEAEVIKKNKLLEVKEKFLHLKADLEKQVAQRNAKIQSIESKLKQRELNMNQRQEELQRKNSEVEATRENLTAQLDLIEKKKQDLDKLHQKEVEHLETLSGLSAEEAKERLIESLKDEAKTEAASYINEIIEEANTQANHTIDDANAQASIMVSEQEVVRLANNMAADIKRHAEEDARDTRYWAEGVADKTLEQLQNQLHIVIDMASHLLDQTQECRNLLTGVAQADEPAEYQDDRDVQ